MFEHRYQGSAKPNLPVEFLGGFGILAAGLLHGMLFPASSRSEKPERTAIVEVEAESAWQNLNAPQLIPDNHENGSVR